MVFKTIPSWKAKYLSLNTEKQFLLFSQAAGRARILNPPIWLADHALVTDLAFYDTAQGLDVFPAEPKFRS